MALLEILPDSNPVMRKTSRRVRRVDDKLRRLVEDMYQTMVENWGVGLAAIQVGVRKRLFIYEIPRREMRGYETCRRDSSIRVRETGHDEPEEEQGGPEAETVDPGYTGDFTVCINPKIISRDGSYIDDEGCLSKLGWMAKVERAYEVTFQAYDLDMKPFERTVTGLEARCIQHEIDHMDGILFTDRATPGTLREITEEEEEQVEDRMLGSEDAPAEELEDSAVGAE